MSEQKQTFPTKTVKRGVILSVLVFLFTCFLSFAGYVPAPNLTVADNTAPLAALNTYAAMLFGSGNYLGKEWCDLNVYKAGDYGSQNNPTQAGCEYYKYLVPHANTGSINPDLLE